MATLEKIRSKSVFLIVVIGVALLAFIIGDAITNSQNLFGDRTTVAKVGGTKIDYTEYDRKVREYQEQAQGQADGQVLQQAALEDLINEQLLDEAVKEMKIGVSGDMLREALFSQGNNPQMQQLLMALNQQGVAVSTPEQAYEVLFVNKKSGLSDQATKQLQNVWMAMEAEAKKGVARSLYLALWQGTLRANDLDKKALYDDEMAAQSVKIAMLPMLEVDEKKYAPSDAELTAEYNKTHNLYKLTEPVKRTSVIAVNVSPSEADLSQSKALCAEARKALSDSAGNASLSAAALKAGVAKTSNKNIKEQIPANMRQKLLDAPTGEVVEVYDNIQGFMLAKKTGVLMEYDSLQLNMVAVPDAALANRVIASLNSGLALDSLTKVYGDSVVVANKEQWVNRYANNNYTMTFTDAELDSLSSGRYFQWRVTPQGTFIAKAVETKPKKAVYTYDVVDYKLIPSATTLSEQQAKLQKFIDENPTAQAFNDKAAEAGYSVRQYNIMPSMPGLPMYGNANNYTSPGARNWGQVYENTAGIVGWVMRDGKPGQVRPTVYENNNTQAPVLFAVAVDSEFEDYVPLAQVKDELTRTLTTRKAAADKAEEVKGKKPTSVEAAAQHMGNVSVREIPSFHLNGRDVPERKMAGEIAGTEPGKLVVIAGDNGVYAFQVTGTSKNELRPYDAKEYEGRWLQMAIPVRQPAMQLFNALRGNKKVDNRLYKFMSRD